MLPTLFKRILHAPAHVEDVEVPVEAVAVLAHAVQELLLRHAGLEVAAEAGRLRHQPLLRRRRHLHSLGTMEGRDIS